MSPFSSSRKHLRKNLWRIIARGFTEKFCKAKLLDKIILTCHNSPIMTDDNDILTRRVHINMLYDFYSPLLTERQRKVYETLCFSDLTPTEAAEVLSMSRQAVHTLTRNIMDKLESLEGLLHFAANTKHLEVRIKELEQENAQLRAELTAKEEE